MSGARHWSKLPHRLVLRHGTNFRGLSWEAKHIEMHTLLEKEDPYSYYRGQSLKYENLNDQEKTARTVWYAVPIATIVGLGAYWWNEEEKRKTKRKVEILGEGEEHTIVNWSATHAVTTKRFFQPESVEALEALVAKAAKHKLRLRVIGAGLSPNGIGLDGEGMVSLALMDKVLSVDRSKQQVTVQAGITVTQVIEALRPYGLTLQNLASINAQQIGGFMQVSAHGTGATLPPVDEQVVGLKLVTPGQGTISLSREDPEDLELLRMSRVALGALGVVAEATLQCVPAHSLVEQTAVMTSDQVEREHVRLLGSNRHVRYMWIPYTDTVVVVSSNPLQPLYHPARWWGAISRSVLAPKPTPDSERLKPMRDLLVQSSNGKQSPDAISGLSLAQLRDELLAVNPLDVEHIKKVNRAEALCWQQSQGVRVAPSDGVLGFECGGQQWVSEVAFPAGKTSLPDGSDLRYTRELLSLIEASGIPAPAPLEQRWSAASASPMSPAGGAKDDLFSWLGIIMYLPEDDAQQREAITDAFLQYKAACREQLWGRYDCREHWAKIEEGESKEETEGVRQRLKRQYPVAEFNALRARFDPDHILANPLVTALLGPKSSKPS